MTIQIRLLKTFQESWFLIAHRHLIYKLYFFIMIVFSMPPVYPHCHAFTNYMLSHVNLSERLPCFSIL